MFSLAWTRTRCPVVLAGPFPLPPSPTPRSTLEVGPAHPTCVNGASTTHYLSGRFPSRIYSQAAASSLTAVPWQQRFSFPWFVFHFHFVHQTIEVSSQGFNFSLCEGVVLSLHSTGSAKTKPYPEQMTPRMWGLFFLFFPPLVWRVNFLHFEVLIHR